MFGGSKVKLDKDLLERCKKYSQEAGYSSVEEFITHTLEKELRKVKTKGSRIYRISNIIKNKELNTRLSYKKIIL